MRSPISFLSCLLPWRLTPCRPPGHWAEPGIARPVEARCDPAKAFIYPPYTGHTPDLLTRLPRHSSEETEISLSKKRPLVHMLSLDSRLCSWMTQTSIGGLKERKGALGINGEDRCVLPTKREVTTHAPCAAFQIFLRFLPVT